jgi:hypothetical protein
MIESVERVCFQRLLDAVKQLHIGRFVKITNSKQSFRFIHTFFSENCGMCFFIDDIIASLCAINVLTLFQIWNDGVGILIFISGRQTGRRLAERLSRSK